MKRQRRDPSADVLLDLDGQVLVVDSKGEYWVRLSVCRVATTAERPHGLRYSLTLHGSDGGRLLGFDNAHSVPASKSPGGKGRGGYDHKHRFQTVRPYQFKDPASLLGDFWAEVDSVLKQKGVI